MTQLNLSDFEKIDKRRFWDLLTADVSDEELNVFGDFVGYNFTAKLKSS